MDLNKRSHNFILLQIQLTVLFLPEMQVSFMFGA